MTAWMLGAAPMRRNEKGIPEDKVEVSGIMIKRNPGVTLVWTTKQYKAFSDGKGKGGVLFDVGVPENVQWYCEGRYATRDEVLASINSGLPILRGHAITHSANKELDRQIAMAMRLVPQENSQCLLQS
jgi:hypothetical protein